MGRMTAESMINYEALAQEAMRNVVRSVLTEAAEKGLPGDHHFYISFDTLAPGVILSKRLREKYAEEMTIVLQHRFWDLIITDQRFEVKLTFDGIPERLVVPFKSIRVFFDPSVRYGLQFESVGAAMDAAKQSDEPVAEEFDDPFADREFREGGKTSPTPVPLKRDDERPLVQIAATRRRRQKPGGADDEQQTPEPVASDEQADDDAALADTDANVDENRGAEVVSLDAFRKK